MNAFALAIGAVVVGLITLFGTLIYVMTAASRVETVHYYGDHNTFSEDG